ncbi:probable NAD kinase 2, chloroplastic [Phragmites australis]|uniref:probable NAD kinase 2, chloroplastic n=1 Tax=Phragmites australis TaxID=29695 RepID=UPI002D78BE19|nr:probable NAD kinase 2, chloroplastic [Phragmites australis]
MLEVCARHGPAKLPAALLAGVRVAGRWAWWRPSAAAAAAAPRHGVAARASSFGSRIGLDSQNFHTRDLSQLLWVGPVPGDIAEVEAYCRIFRAAEQLHTAVMSALCDPETGECPVRYDVESEDLPVLEDKVAAVLGCMLALLNRGRNEVLSGRMGVASAFQGSEDRTLDRIPPLAVFRGDMKRCCESMQVALASYLVPSEARGLDIWRRLQRLKNACYDAGFPRADGYPCPTLFANWFPVYLSTALDDSGTDDLEVAFWRGGQVSEEGLAWLLEKGFRTIVDLQEEDVKDDLYLSAVQEAVSSGKIEVVNMPVEIGTAPSAEQVQQFAALVSDGAKKPIYLHSKEGVSRTSAMVSRWKQHVTRSERLAVQYRSPNENGRLLKNDKTEQHRGSPSSSTNASKNGTPVESDRTMKNEETSEIDIEAARHNLEVTNALSSDQNTEQGEMHGTRAELMSNFRLESNPLKAQFPACDFFSRKEMTNFFRSKKVSPKSVLNSRRRSSSFLVTRRKQNLSAKHNGATDYEAAEFTVLKSSNETSFDNDYILSVASGITNGKPSNDGASTLIEEKEREASVITVGPRTYSASISNGNAQVGAQKTAEKNGAPYLDRNLPDLVDGNMCASATGVVRIQSRRKAEMFLVRTDGFSCTREKVTESSLAFTHPSTQQQMLMWKSPPKTVLLLKKLGDELMEEAKEVASFLHHQEKMNVLVEPDVHDIFARIPGYGFVQTFYSQDTSDLHERVDFVACLGGDGVILHASNLFRTSVPPVVSFNLGSLGFLTSHNFEGFRQDLRAVIHGNNTLGVYITLRMRIRCEIFRNGKAMPGKVFDVLNEVVIDRGSNPYLSKIECYEHNHLITKVQGDGVIVATPTGSTAYSTAAGGSMVHPNVPCMLFTPICPHSLSFRPVILPDSARLELKIPDDARSNAWVSFDGKRRQQLSRGDSVRISMSQHPLPTVNKSDQTGDWFRSLIRCLNWNERLDQKAL